MGYEIIPNIAGDCLEYIQAKCIRKDVSAKEVSITFHLFLKMSNIDLDKDDIEEIDEEVLDIVVDMINEDKIRQMDIYKTMKYLPDLPSTVN